MARMWWQAPSCFGWQQLLLSSRHPPLTHCLERDRTAGTKARPRRRATKPAPTCRAALVWCSWSRSFLAKPFLSLFTLFIVGQSRGACVLAGQTDVTSAISQYLTNVVSGRCCHSTSLHCHVRVAIHGRQESEKGKAFHTMGPVPFSLNGISEDLRLEDFFLLAIR